MQYTIIISCALLATCAQCSQLLTSYLPASMQALAYYIDLLQYEPQSMTTVEPPFIAEHQDDENGPTQSPFGTTRPPNVVNQSSWITQNFWGALTTPTPLIVKTTTTTTTAKTTTTRSSTAASSSSSTWWKPPTTATPSSTTTLHPWFSISTNAQSTAAPPTRSTTRRTTSTTTRTPSTSTTVPTTRKTTESWWSYSTVLTKKPPIRPTEPHRPGLYAPYQRPPKYRHLIEQQQSIKKFEPYHAFNDIGDYPDDMGTLTFSLIRDIQAEKEFEHFANDVELLDNFMRLYDDNYGRATMTIDATTDPWPSASNTGKKRIPPTKPYVEFLLVYDLLKRDAKSSNLSKYEGYSEEMLQELNELSHVSAARQLHTLLKRMLDRGDVERNDVVLRLRSIVKDLGDPESITSRSLRNIPALQFAI